jgi:hypothetical protein
MRFMYFPGKIGHFLENLENGGIWIIIFSKYFKIQFAWLTFQKRSWTVMMIMSTTFQRQNYKMRLKQRSLNWINSMQVKKILFTNVFFSWSLCLLNMFPSMVFPRPTLLHDREDVTVGYILYINVKINHFYIT